MDEEESKRPDAPPPSAAKRRQRRTSRVQRGKLRRDLDIDHVKVEEPFVLNQPNASDGGEGCYVTATVNSRRFYGVLIDQAAMKSASLLHFQNEASGLDLNRRMRALLGQEQPEQQEQQHETSQPTNGNSEQVDERKRAATSTPPGNSSSKRPRGPVPFDAPSSTITTGISDNNSNTHQDRQVQKFRYNDDGIRGYRTLEATYADILAASEDNPSKTKLIEAACGTGGNYVGEYYYQYETRGNALEVPSGGAARRNNGPEEMQTSMGFQEFLAQTALPAWYPLANLQFGKQQVLNLLNLKKDNKGNVVYDEKAEERKAAGVIMPINNDLTGSVIPMEPRAVYRVCVVGGGIAGLSACLEIFQKCERDNIQVEVCLIEGRPRIGGRLLTDTETFKARDGSPFPVELGASWIHGIDHNPLAALAREAGVDFVRSSEDVKMFQAGMKEVDQDKDTRAGEFFDQLLDIAAESSWGLEGDETALAESRDHRYNQKVVRWFASGLRDTNCSNESAGNDHREPIATDVPPHRKSNDVSVDQAVGNAIANQKFDEFNKLCEEERRMLVWNLKNVEYALGANLSSLSMKFWDIDERHAFEGDHVLLREGYGTVVAHVLKQLLQRGKFFQYHVNCAVGKIEYARKTTSQTYAGGIKGKGAQQLIDLSDTCCVKSEDGTKTINCDFVVCAVPLGVLKESVENNRDDGNDNQAPATLGFSPPLPTLKLDAIESVGFGLLDKVYLQFPWAFWRTGNCRLNDDQSLFGNASGKNPHHYMFFDIGKILGNPQSSNVPAILMSLVSGKEAAKCECLSQDELVKETMETLRALFSEVRVPDPIAVRTTKWGSDRFSRGSYTFLPPGATEHDFNSLQSPVNGNGDSLLLEGSETMRLFFAGEHTTALHPSMAHGAMLSGIRAGSEVFKALSLSFQADETIDRMIPMSVFRYMNPKTPLQCAFCHVSGGRAYEGPLLAFKRGSRQVLSHNCCAEYSPEVEVSDGHWKYVLRAVNRSAAIQCQSCKQTGASIGCNDEHCFKCYHFACAEQTGWKFGDDGKEFYCQIHRPEGTGTGPVGGPAGRKRPTKNKDSFQHALFASLSGEHDSPSAKDTVAVDTNNPGVSGKSTSLLHPRLQHLHHKTEQPKAEIESSTATDKKYDSAIVAFKSIGQLTTGLDEDGQAFSETHLIRLTRESLRHCWNVEFTTRPLPPPTLPQENISSTTTAPRTMKSILTVSKAEADDPFEPLVEGDVVVAINGVRIGSPDLDSIEKVVNCLGRETDIMMEVRTSN